MQAATNPTNPEGEAQDGEQAGEDGGLRLGSLFLSNLETSPQRNLQVLDLKDSKIATLPSQVYHVFSQARVLDLRKNVLQELLPDIAAMEMLEELLVDQNRLREIPAEVCLLPNLKILSVSQNALVALPKGMGRMASLRSLSLGDNQIAEIPEELGNCKELQNLFLHHNHFTRLPTSLHLLENLSELALEWFRYTTPPLPRVIKGAEWKRIILKFIDMCKDKHGRESHVGLVEVLSHFSQKTFDPNAIDSKRRTRLHVACLEGHVGVAVALAERGTKCDSLDCEGYSPLLVAVREEHPDIASALVRVGVDVNRGGGLFGSPLHVATVNFDPQMVVLLIRGRADVNQTDADGNTPLHVLMSVFDKGGKRAGVIGQILLRHGADCNLMNSDRWAPLHLAARRGQLRGICFVLNHIDSVSVACLKGTCSHRSEKNKSGRVRTCPRAFDLNLKGGSHLWTPLHLAGHACHVPVVQVLIEAGADIFLRNIDGRTPRHVSRGNLAISKLLRKAEGEWLWHRIHQKEETTLDPDVDVSEQVDEDHDRNSQTSTGSAANGALAVAPEDFALLETLKSDDEEDDQIEAIAKTIEGVARDDSRRGRESDSRPVEDPRKRHWILEKCCDTHFTKSERQQLESAIFLVPCTAKEFATLFAKLVQQGPKHRLPFLLSRPWVAELLPALLEDPEFASLIFGASLMANEDFVRALVRCVPRESLRRLGAIRSSEQETLLQALCKDTPRAQTGASAADVLAFLLAVCPPDTFDLEARDLRGQTPLHLAAQSGDVGLAQVLLEHGSDPNAREETTGWTPLHFAVSKAHYPLILQLLHHDTTNVNLVDKFCWPPLLEACSRLDARSTSLLVNGGARLSFRNQHEFDVLRAIDTSMKDLAAKKWMSCLVVSNGFDFKESTIQLSTEDRETLTRESAFYDGRTVPNSRPPFFVPDHLSPRCYSCKVAFTVTFRRYHCRSCGLALCGGCFKWRGTHIVALDERIKSRQMIALNAAVELSLKDRNVGRAAPVKGVASEDGKDVPGSPPTSPTRSDGSFEDPPLSEEVSALAPPMNVVLPAASNVPSVPSSKLPLASARTDKQSLPRGLSRERMPGQSSGRVGAVPPRTVRLCGPCATFFEVGVGETYGMLQHKEAMHALAM